MTASLSPRFSPFNVSPFCSAATVRANRSSLPPLLFFLSSDRHLWPVCVCVCCCPLTLDDEDVELRRRRTSSVQLPFAQLAEEMVVILSLRCPFSHFHYRRQAIGKCQQRYTELNDGGHHHLLVICLLYTKRKKSVEGGSAFFLSTQSIIIESDCCSGSESDGGDCVSGHVVDFRCQTWRTHIYSKDCSFHSFQVALLTLFHFLITQVCAD